MKLSQLNLRDNKIKTLVENIFSTNLNLVWLNLSDNLIIDIMYDFVHNTYLKNIYLDGNPLRGLNMSAFKSLMYKRDTDTTLNMFLKLENFTCDCTQLWLSNHKMVYLVINGLNRYCADKSVPSLRKTNVMCLLNVCGDKFWDNELREAQLYCEQQERGFISLHLTTVFIQL